MRVAVIDLDGEAGQDLQAELGTRADLSVLQGDVTQEADVGRAVAACIDSFGGVWTGWSTTPQSPIRTR